MLDNSKYCTGTELMVVMGSITPINEQGARLEASRVGTSISSAFFKSVTWKGRVSLNPSARKLFSREEYFDNRPPGLCYCRFESTVNPTDIFPGLTDIDLLIDTFELPLPQTTKRVLTTPVIPPADTTGSETPLMSDASLKIN
jgi:hypothetical protein